MTKSILCALLVLVVLLVVYLLWTPSSFTPKPKDDVSEGFRRFRETNLSDLRKIVISKGKTAPVELKKEGGEWVVGSAYGYPADGEQLAKIVKSLGELKKGDMRGESVESHGDFEVDKKKGAFITLHGKDDKELGRLVVGKSDEGRGLIGSSRVFMRFGDEPITYAVESELRTEARLYNKDAESKTFLLKDVVKIPEQMEVESVRLIRPEKPDLLLERKVKEVPVEEPKKDEALPPDGAPPAEGEKEKKPETKKETYFVVTSGTETKEIGKSEEYQAKSLLDYKKTITVEDAVEPKPLAEYGLDKPQLKVVVSYRVKDVADAPLKTVTLLFGNAKKDEKGETKSYHFALEGAEYQSRVYLVQSYNFDSWNKEMKDYLPKPKEEPKAKDEPKPPEAKEGVKTEETDTGATAPKEAGAESAVPAQPPLPPVTPQLPASPEGAAPSEPKTPIVPAPPPTPAPEAPKSPG